jgi:hypothetical protein
MCRVVHGRLSPSIDLSRTHLYSEPVAGTDALSCGYDNVSVAVAPHRHAMLSIRIDAANTPGNRWQRW